jgi:competence ComEA-like helix-hairpin-helix protein
MNRLVLIKIIFVFILTIPLCLSICEEGQININSASIEELQEFTGIGPIKAQAIIDYREYKNFESVDELIEVSGIGSITLENMKNEGACIEENNSSDKEIEQEKQKEDEDIEEDENIEENIEKEDENKEKSEEDNSQNIKYEENLKNIKRTESEKNKIESINLNPINLNIESLKDKNKENPNLVVYGLFTFCLLLGFLFIKRRVRVNKNEFE